MMRTRQEIERDLTAAKAELVAEEAIPVTPANRTVRFTACQAATAKVRRFEQELRNFRPDPLAALTTPVRPVAPAVATPPRTNPVAVAVVPIVPTRITTTRVRTPRTTPATTPCQTPTQLSSFDWRWLLVPVVLWFCFASALAISQWAGSTGSMGDATPPPAVHPAPPPATLGGVQEKPKWDSYADCQRHYVLTLRVDPEGVCDDLK